MRFFRDLRNFSQKEGTYLHGRHDDPQPRWATLRGPTDLPDTNLPSLPPFSTVMWQSAALNILASSRVSFSPAPTPSRSTPVRAAPLLPKG